jgi:membrane protein YdbS with pleckstrin-like domain
VTRPLGASGRGRRPRWSKDAEKYLLPGEDPVIATRRHWAVLAVPVAKGIPLLLVGGWLLILDPRNRVTSSIGLLVLLGALVWLGAHVAEWWMRHFIITRRRVLLTSGVLVRTVALMPLRRITDLTWKETLVGQLLGYGTFKFESAGQDQALSQVTFLPDADELYREVSRLLFGRDWGASGGDDEGDPPAGPPQRGPRYAGTGDTAPLPPLPPRHPR